MSEPKAFELKVGKNLETDSPIVVGVDNKWNSRIMSCEEVYLKSEADKVIAEKDTEIAELLAEVEDVINTYKASVESKVKIWERCKKAEADTAEKDKEISHQKYKRCLTMAMLCSSYKFAWSFIPEDDEVHKSDFYDKWKLRWLELAKKFKEAT